MTYHKKITIGLATVVALAGCATKRENRAIPKECLATPSRVVMTQLSGLEKPGFYKIGNQGIIDCLINEAMTDSLAQRVEQIDAQPIVKTYYTHSFESEFVGSSFQVTKAPTSRLNPIDNDEKQAPFDFKPLKAQYGAEYALVLQPRMFGVQRSYYGFIPTSAPAGVADFSIYLVKLSDNSVIGNYNANVITPVNGEWDTPPAYSAVVEASQEALKKGLTDARGYLFGNK